MKNLIFFDKIKPFYKDSSYSKRKISIHKFQDVQITGDTIHYPLALIHDLSSSNHILPLREKFMSLGRGVIYERSMKYKFIHKKIKKIDNNFYFYFIYNNANYYHFIYDTLPYLWNFFTLKKSIPKIKILTNFPENQKQNYDFFYDCLALLGINKNSITIANSNTVYSNLFISTSLTHNGKSNSPPHPNIYKVYEKFKYGFLKSNKFSKIYISRRTWIKNKKNIKNIGTDYTLRRQLINEDEIVSELSKYGFREVFCEDLTMSEKINLFKNAKYVIGPIGGGMCNLLFAKQNTKVLSINSPLFFQINKRFIYSMSHTNLTHFNDTSFIKDPKTSISGKGALSISGGLNTPWMVNLPKFKKILQKFMS